MSNHTRIDKQYIQYIIYSKFLHFQIFYLFVYLDIPDCDAGWTSVEGSCFKVIDEVKNWDGAKANCESLGGRLAVIDSATKNHNVG